MATDMETSLEEVKCDPALHNLICGWVLSLRMIVRAVDKEEDDVVAIGIYRENARMQWKELDWNGPA